MKRRNDLRSLGESISRQLRAWADSLQNSPIKGQRYLTEKTRQQEEQTRRVTAFWEQVEEAHKKRFGG